MIRQGNGSGYKVEFVGGPLCGDVRTFARLDDQLELYYGQTEIVTDEVIYRRVQDGKANPWRYQFVSQRPIGVKIEGA